MRPRTAAIPLIILMTIAVIVFALVFGTDIRVNGYSGPTPTPAPTQVFTATPPWALRPTATTESIPYPGPVNDPYPYPVGGIQEGNTFLPIILCGVGMCTTPPFPTHAPTETLAPTFAPTPTEGNPDPTRRPPKPTPTPTPTAGA